jgi:hypothetical protein
VRTRIDRWECIKLKCFCASKETVTRMKRQIKECEKIIASYLSDKKLRCRIYKELKRTNNPKNEQASVLNIHSSHKRYK